MLQQPHNIMSLDLTHCAIHTMSIDSLWWRVLKYELCLHPVRGISPYFCGFVSFFFFPPPLLTGTDANANWCRVVNSLTGTNAQRQTQKHQEDFLTLTLWQHRSETRPLLADGFSWTQHLNQYEATQTQSWKKTSWLQTEFSMFCFPPLHKCGSNF